MSENPHDFTLKIVSIETKFNQTSQKIFRPLGICLINKKSTPMARGNNFFQNFFTKKALFPKGTTTNTYFTKVF